MRKRTLDEFILEAKNVHGDKYDYSHVFYESSAKKICIICPEHGEFWQTPYNHLKGCGCNKCVHVAQRSNAETFIAKCKKIYGDLYDYSKVEYTHNKKKICVICPIHGEFWVTPNNHLRGSRCPECYGTPKKTKENFIKQAREVHGDKYDYSKVNYKGTDEKVCIICPEHGEFWQTPNNHLFGAGCPVCPQSALEETIRDFLERHNIRFESEKTFDWLKYRKSLFLDFFLPDYSVAIECQGSQHFIPSDYYGGDESFDKVQKRDVKKKKLCEKHGIKMIYFSNLGITYPYPVIEDTAILLKAIYDADTDTSKWKDPELPFTYE